MRRAIGFLAVTALLGMAVPVPVHAHAAGHSERLAARARRRDRVARAALVEEHMSLVRAVAFRYRGLGLPVEDLVQEGAIGLLSAVDDYDASRGTSFSTFAFWRVRGAITHAVTARGGLVRVPRPVLERRRAVAAAQRELSATGRQASSRDLGVATALPPAQVAEALAQQGTVSLETLVDGSPIGDRLADNPAARPDALVIAAIEGRALRAALRHLRQPKQTILKRHFGIDRDPETLVKIAADLRLSRARTRALKDEALRELRSTLAGAA